MGWFEIRVSILTVILLCLILVSCPASADHGEEIKGVRLQRSQILICDNEAAIRDIFESVLRQDRDAMKSKAKDYAHDDLCGIANIDVVLDHEVEWGIGHDGLVYVIVAWHFEGREYYTVVIDMRGIKARFKVS